MRKHCCSTFCLCIYAFLLIGVSSFAEEIPFSGEVNNENINVRSDTTTTAEPILKISKGTIVSVNKELYDWYRINLPKEAPCFINQHYIQVLTDKIGKVSGENVNIRAKPDKASPILGQAKQGEIVNIVEKVLDWYKIEPTENVFGWINKKFVDRVRELPRVEVAPKEAGAKEEKDLYEGVLEDSGRTLFWSGRHKLITDDKSVYLLKGNKYLLNQAVHHRIKVSGKIDANYKGKFPLIIAEKFEVLN